MSGQVTLALAPRPPSDLEIGHFLACLRVAERIVGACRFLCDDAVTLVPDDNICGHGLPGLLKLAANSNAGATVFACHFRDPGEDLERVAAA